MRELKQFRGEIGSVKACSVGVKKIDLEKKKTFEKQGYQDRENIAYQKYSHNIQVVNEFLVVCCGSEIHLLLIQHIRNKTLTGEKLPTARSRVPLESSLRENRWRYREDTERLYLGGALSALLKDTRTD